MLKFKAKKCAKRIIGFSLVELLIALFLGSLLLAMVVGLYATGVSTGSKSLKYSRLRADLQSIMAMIETDIRRAGYGGNQYLVGASANKTIDINSDANCIVYYYNHDQSLNLESNNKMAFSLKDNTVKFKSGVGQVANDVCAVTTGWIDVSDDKFVNITGLKFTENVTSTSTATMRSVKIELSGNLVSDTHYSHAITTRVQVRNIELN